jgi:hypothetical protein
MRSQKLLFRITSDSQAAEPAGKAGQFSLGLLTAPFSIAPTRLAAGMIIDVGNDAMLKPRVRHQ